MRSFLIPRPSRLNVTLEVGIRLLVLPEQKTLTPAVPGRLVNFSREGGCLVLPTVMVDGHHLFFQTLQSESHGLQLANSPSLPSLPPFVIIATSIWMRAEEVRTDGFLIGLRFHERQDTLYRQLRKTASGNRQERQE